MIKIAVIGDYESPFYHDFVARIKMVKPEEDVLDLSKHKSGSWKKILDARFEDIFSSHLVVIAANFRTSLNARRDITYAQQIGRECLIENDGRLLPFPEYAREI
jgi:hypothetical protein